MGGAWLNDHFIDMSRTLPEIVADGDYLDYFGAAHAEELWQQWYARHLRTIDVPQFEHPELYRYWEGSLRTHVLTCLMLEFEDFRLRETEDVRPRLSQIRQETEDMQEERRDLEQELLEIGDERL